jgi:hypothetical protein
MQNIFEIAKDLRPHIALDKLFIKIESKVIFVCGAKRKSPRAKTTTNRTKMIAYGEAQLNDFSFFEAERAFEFLKGRIDNDMLSLENAFADYSDCILIILESYGAAAELGAFANNEKTEKLILVVTDKKYEKGNSFIKDGPIRYLQDISDSSAAMYVEFKAFETEVQQISDRLRSKLIKQKRKSINVSTYYRFKKKTYGKHRLFYLADIISLFSPVSPNELVGILRVIYKKSSVSDIDIKIELGILSALQLIKKFEMPDKSELIYRTERKKDLYYCDFDSRHLTRVRSVVYNYYEKYMPERLERWNKERNI